MKTHPRGLLVAAALLLPIAGHAPRGAAAPVNTIPSLAPRPNVVLVVTDDQDLLLGSLDAMPRLRELLIEKGTTFSGASPICVG